MNVLVIGSGGREHAIVDALSRSARVGKIFCAPGNAGIARQAECVPIGDTEVERLRDFAVAHAVDLTVVGPESALAAGVVDAFKAAGLRIFGPTKAAATVGKHPLRVRKNSMRGWRRPRPGCSAS